jgi:hypothetical protein
VIKKAEALRLAFAPAMVRCSDWAESALGGSMKNLVALTPVAAPGGGLASSSGTVTATIAPKSGTETTYARFTGLAATAIHPTFRLTPTGLVAITASIPLCAPPEMSALP